MTRFLALTGALLLATAALAAEKGTPRRLCAEDLPEGAPLPSVPSCGPVATPKARADGFRDLGNGVSVRIGGRAQAEYGVSR